MRNVRRSSRRWSNAGEVPAAGMDDEPVRAQLAARPLAAVGAVPRADALAASDGLCENEHRVACDGRPGAGRRREAERGLERLDAAAEQVGEDAVDLVERAVHRPRVAVEPLPASRDQPEHDDHRLVVGEHQRRQPVPGTDAIATAHAALPLDRDPELLERRDVAAHRAGVDRQTLGDLSTRRQRAGLEHLEQLEQPSRGRLHGRESTTDRGQKLP